MTFLQKLGTILLKVTQVITGFQPIQQVTYPQASNVVTKVLSELSLLSGLVVQAEAMGQALGIKGPDKAKAIAPLVAQMVLQSEMMVGREIGDVALFQKGCIGLGGDIADILNSLKPKIDTQDKA